jgi:hypothetical protein
MEILSKETCTNMPNINVISCFAVRLVALALPKYKQWEAQD